jgi:hypothetical protein
MQSKLIARLVITSFIILLTSFCLAGYLALSAPATFIITDRQQTLAEIQATATIDALRTRASGLAMVGNNATQICKVLFGISVWTLLVFAVLSVFNLMWLHKLKRTTDKDKTV